MTNLNVQDLRQHVALQPADQRGDSWQVVNPFVIEEDPVERNRIELELRIRVEDSLEGFRIAGVIRQQLERVGIETRRSSQFGVLRQLARYPEPSGKQF